MYIDLILGNDYFTDLNFDKVLTVEPIEFRSKKDFKIKLRKTPGLKVVWGGKFNREVIESSAIDILLSPERGVKKDSFHHRNSGLNNVICRLAKRKKIAIGFSFNEVLINKGAKRAEIIGRMMQNVRLCRKYQLRMVLGSFAKNKWQMRLKNDLISFGVVLGMHQKEAIEALKTVDKIIKEKEEKKYLVLSGVKKVE